MNVTATFARPSSRRRRPRLLDLCCKAGGASAGYYAAGFDVVGVDIEDQPHYPFPFIRADALTVDLSGFEVIAGSPPCTPFSAATPARYRDRHPDLVAPLRDRLIEAVTTLGGPWAYVIENVPGAPLLDPVTVCGDTLRLGVRRHRLFESNIALRGTDCHHDRTTPTVAVYGSYGQRIQRTAPVAAPAELPTDAARRAMGIDWMPWPELTQAIPPPYTFWLGTQLLAHRPADAGHEPVRDATPSTLDGSVTTAHDVDGVASRGDTTALGGSVTTGREPAGLVSRTCRCGGPLPARPTTGRWPRYCSQACRQAAYRDRQRPSA